MLLIRVSLSVQTCISPFNVMYDVLYELNKFQLIIIFSFQSQEMQDLENQFRTKRKLMVDDALSKLHEKYDKLRDSLAKQHQEELAALQVK